MQLVEGTCREVDGVGGTPATPLLPRVSAQSPSIWIGRPSGIPELAQPGPGGRIKGVDKPIAEIADQQHGVVAGVIEAGEPRRGDRQPPRRVQRATRDESDRTSGHARGTVQVEDVHKAVVRTGHVVTLAASCRA